MKVIPAKKKIRHSAEAPEKPKLKVAAYCRVSTDSDEQATSYEAQVEHYTTYIRSNPDWECAGIYADDGISGTNTKKREEFNRMIADIRSCKINCVVVKDLSRLGRNYLEAGDYIEKIFPFFGVRFIAVTDNYDSLTSNPTEDGLVVPLKNLINEAHAKDI